MIPTQELAAFTASYGPPTGNSTSVAKRPIPRRPGIGTRADPSSGLKAMAPSTRTAARTK